MVNLKATVRVKTKSGLNPVYIRFTKSNQVSYVKTSWVVNENGLSDKKEITDPFVIQAARVDGANKLAEIFRIRLPLASSYILVGLSSSLAMSFKVEIMAEVLTGMTKGGIGAAISAFQGSEANLNNVFGYTLIVVVIVLVFTSVSEYLKKVFINK